MFRPYLVGRKFVVESDHKSLKWLKNSKSGRLARWALALSEFDFDIKFKTGKQNVVADALSRNPIETSDLIETCRLEKCLVLDLCELKHFQFNQEDIKYHQRNDPDWQDVIEECIKNENKSKNKEFILVDELLYKVSRDGKDLLIIPFQLIEPILDFYHNDNLMLHVSSNRLYSILRKRFYWHDMFSDVNNYVAACVVCRKHKDNQPVGHGLLNPISSTKPFELVGVDFLVFNKSQGDYQYVLVCIDHFTSWVEAAPMKTMSSKEVIDTFINLIISRHGCPEKVLTDQGKQFVSQAFDNLCKHFNIEHVTTTAYHQQCNGKTERFNKFLTDTLATNLNGNHQNWHNIIDLCLFTYRTSISRTLNETPFYLIYARDALLPQDLELPVDKRNLRSVEDADIYKYKLLQRKILKEAYEKLNKYKDIQREKYKQYYDQTHRHVIFKVGDQVMLFTPPSLQEGEILKFKERFNGPFTVIVKNDDVTYTIESQDKKKFFKVHVQRLRAYRPWKGPQKLAEKNN